MTRRQCTPVRLDQYVNHDSRIVFGARLIFKARHLLVQLRQTPCLYSRPGLYLRPGLYSRKYGITASFVQQNNCLLIWSPPFSSEIGNSAWLKFLSCIYNFRLMRNGKPDWESRNYKFLSPMECSINRELLGNNTNIKTL